MRPFYPQDRAGWIALAALAVIVAALLALL